MQYAIITNPASGRLSVDQKRIALTPAAALLEARIHGLDTTTAKEFRQCAAAVAQDCEVLVVAGGDGTFSDVINAVDRSAATVAFLPLGTGNALRYALGYEGDLPRIALHIKEASIRRFDLIDCGAGQCAFMASVGIEGTIITLRDRYQALGARGFKTYLKAVLVALFRDYRPVGGAVCVDDSAFPVSDILSLMIVKEPYYGFGMRVVPKARFDDGALHVLLVKSGALRATVGALTAFTVGNRVGWYRTGRRVTATLNRPIRLQIDGNAGRADDRFAFTVLPRELRIKG